MSKLPGKTRTRGNVGKKRSESSRAVYQGSLAKHKQGGTLESSEVRVPQLYVKALWQNINKVEH